MLIKNILIVTQACGLLGVVSIGLLALSGCVVQPVGEVAVVAPVPVLVGPEVVVPVVVGPGYAPRGYYRR